MDHQIYTGAFAELEEHCAELIDKLKHEDPLLEINLLVGSNLLASYLKHRFAEKGRTFANLRFHTFETLAGRLAALEGTQRTTHLPALGASLVLENILELHNAGIFAQLSQYRGFRDSLLDTFRDLRDADISPGELETAIEDGNRVPDRLPHLRALSDLYRRFRERVSIFHDIDDDFRAAIRQVSIAGRLSGIRQLLVYGIYDCTGLQSQLLSSLKNALGMIYFIPFVEESISDFAHPFLRTRAAELGVEPVPLKPQAARSSLDMLAAQGFGLSGELKTGEAEGLISDGSFCLVSAPGESRAAIEILREILRSVQDGTIRGFHEAAVILRQPESDMPILSEMFRLRGIPFFVHGGSSFIDRPLSRAIVALSELEASAYSREAILTAMELVAASLPDESASAWDVPSWRALTNEAAFLSGLQAWDEGIPVLVERARREAQKIEKGFNEAEAEQEDSGRGPRDPANATKRLAIALSLREGWCRLRESIAGWPSHLTWQDWSRFLEQRLGLLLGDSEDWDFAVAALDDLASLQALVPSAVSFDSLKRALTTSLSSFSYPAGRFQRNGVNCIPTSAARGLRFPLVLIPGLDEGRFPAKLRQDPLLLDEERQYIGRLPLKAKRISEEKLLFDMAARSAEKRLVLLTSRLDEGADREIIPSQYFLRAAAAVRGRAVSIRDLSQGTIAGFRSVSLDNPAPAMNEIAVDEGEIRLRLVTASRDTARRVLDELAGMDRFRLTRPLAYDRARWEKRLTEYDGSIANPVLLRWVKQKCSPSVGQVSASRIEEYAKCPYFFFLHRVMNLEAWEEQGKAEAMDPLARGLAVHSILESFFGNYAGEKFFRTPEETLWDFLRNKANAELEQARPAGVPDLLWDIQRDGLIAMLNEWLRFEKNRTDQGMLPTALEQIFGEFSCEKRYPAFRVHAGRHTFDFRGRIDRIDLSADGARARVIDYKTGKLPDTMAKSSRTPLMGGERIQVAVYRGALAVLDKFGEVKTIEGEYLHLQPQDAQTVTSSFADGELQNALNALPHVLEAIGDGIESGLFFARTSGKIRPSGHCDYCDFLKVCGKDRAQREERKAGDPAVLRLLQSLESA
jgi:ATP-dependent helicase/nuclease subunit B